MNNKNKLSTNKIITRIITRKSEAGLLTTSVIDPNDIMIRIIVEEIIKSNTTRSKNNYFSR